jgi:hypothetical protein
MAGSGTEVGVQVPGAGIQVGVEDSGVWNIGRRWRRGLEQK